MKAIYGVDFNIKKAIQKTSSNSIVKIIRLTTASTKQQRKE